VARGRRRDDLVAISGTLALLTNLTMAWVTHEIERAVEIEKSGNEPIADRVLRHIGPVHTGSVNIDGQFTFPISQFASLILPAKAGAS